MTKTKRAECITFARGHGLEIKGKRHPAGKYQDAFFDVSIYCPRTKWVDCFESWDEAHAFLLKHSIAYQQHLTPFPWARKAA